MADPNPFDSRWHNAGMLAKRWLHGVMQGVRDASGISVVIAHVEGPADDRLWYAPAQNVLAVLQGPPPAMSASQWAAARADRARLGRPLDRADLERVCRASNKAGEA